MDKNLQPLESRPSVLESDKVELWNCSNYKEKKSAVLAEGPGPVSSAPRVAQRSRDQVESCEVTTRGQEVEQTVTGVSVRTLGRHTERD
uniref:Uncharacterized protein n=1 Tax=Knipowitschia caucasica TaxID=637954 RepID=A0AAV2M095_KNICA